MPPEFDCPEWTLPLFGAGMALALVKHINPRNNSGVTYYDLTRTIDGGCGTNGGQLCVTVDLDNPAYKTPYKTPEYIASRMKPADIIFKLVRDPN